MPPADRRKSSAGRRPTPAFDQLEARAMLNASPIAHPMQVSAEVMPKTEHSTAKHHSKTVQAEARHDTKARHASTAKSHSSVHTPTAKPAKGAFAHPFATAVDVVVSPDAGNGNPLPSALSPLQVRTAYGITSLPTSNEGQGVTVAIVDVGNVPTIANDLSVFSTEYGLPQADGLNGDPTFTIVAQPGTVNTPVGTGSGLETTLDVEYVHAMAPFANIILEEASTNLYNNGNGGGLLPATHAGASTPGVVDVTVSYGSTEYNGQTVNDSLLAPVAGNPSAIAFSTGDDGYPSYPATSPNVLAVGGTALYLASARGRYQVETAWGGQAGGRAGGGGISVYYGSPSFQSSNGVNDSGRAIPDVSAVGSSETYVSVYDSYDASYYGSSWIGVYGTSVATPVVSGMIALAQQDRIAEGLLPLNSPQINARLYAAYDSPSYLTYLHDVTVGNNYEISSNGTVTRVGYYASTGYDLATGLGSPVGNEFVTLLSQDP